MLVKIAIFNHKGGVSKTTTAFNIGYALAALKKRILLVDTDSQCNLTLYAMGYKNYEKYCEEKNKNNINDCLKPAYKSEPKLIEPAECVEIKKDSIYLLPGNLDFTENEVQLGISMQLSQAFGSMRNLPGALNYLVQKTAEKYKIDYVLFDMNPSLSAINQNVFLTSNYFMVPSSPDFFSIMAIKSLSRILPMWEKWAKEARRTYSDVSYAISNETSKFIGYTINDFNLSNGAPQETFKNFINKISDEFVNTFVPALQKEEMLLKESVYKNAYENMRTKNEKNIEYKDFYCLAQLSNFNKLIAVSNAKSIPIFEIERDSNFSEGQTKTLNWFKFLYKALAMRIIELTNAN